MTVTSARKQNAATASSNAVQQLLAVSQENWMGYHGAESECVNKNFLRPHLNAEGLEYEHRREIFADLKDRLYLIKRDLDLIPEEELRAEEERIRLAREERRRAAEERAIARAIAEQRRREAEARRAAEEERLRLQAEDFARRWKEVYPSDADASDLEEERSRLLTKMSRTQAEITEGNATFAKGVRQLLASHHAVYVSYLDGSEHTTIGKLDAYNRKHRDAVAKTLQGSNVKLPAAAEFDVERLRTALQERNDAREILDAFRCKQDPTYAARLRASEKDASGAPLKVIGNEKVRERALINDVESTKAALVRAQKDYNERAAASAKRVGVVICSNATTADMLAEEPVAVDREVEAVPSHHSTPNEEQLGDYPTEEPAKKSSSKKSSPHEEEQVDEYPTEEPTKKPSSMKTSSKKSSKKASPKEQQA